MFNRHLWSSLTPEWSTPEGVYNELDREFHFSMDPCPIGGTGGLDIPWTGSVFVNPPYGNEVKHWVKKGYESAREGATVVMLVASRTDTRWWHDYCMKGEIRFVRGRLKFGGARNSAPFPSAIVVFNAAIPIPADVILDEPV